MTSTEVEAAGEVLNHSAPPSRVASGAPEVEIDESAWKRGAGRYIFPAFWLFYLLQTASGVSKHNDGVARYVGWGLIVTFAAIYLLCLPACWGGHRRRYWTLFAITLALTLAELPFGRQDTFVFCVYLAVLAVASRNLRFAVSFVAGMAALAALVPPLIPSWHAKLDLSTALTILLVALAMHGFFTIVRSNIALSEARAEVARLAAENERSRIARDLHDLLGHSLTTITVKAGLARRLTDVDPARAAIEIAEVEELTRRALTEVRAAVAGYRDVSLIGELASAREVLRAAGLEATLPTATDVVRPSWSQLFGWVVREGVTNIVRHARARRCTVTLGPDWVDISDDGHGPGTTGSPGSGLKGLAERVQQCGGRVDVSRSELGGFRLHVQMPSDD